MKEDPPLFRFLESQLGKMAGGLIIDNKRDVQVQVARFESQPVLDSITYVTTGISRHRLHQLSGRDIRIELLCCVWSKDREAGLDSVLFLLAEDLLKHHHAPAQGDIAGPNGPIVPGSQLEGFCFVQPLYHPESLASFGTGDDLVQVVWALPVTASEAAFIRESGWPAFEQRVHELDTDLMDLSRVPIA